MKHLPLITILAFILAFIFASASAAVPEDWVVDLAAQPPQVFTIQRPRGETYEIEAVLKRHGKPFEPAITNACIYWQTNGMENLYWSAPASVSNNVLRATWLPSMDPGAATVRGYIGDPGHIYAAAFQFRFIASPGATPNELPLPQKVIDFAKVTVLNPPWSGGGGGGVDTNAVRDIVREQLATNGIRSVDGAARPLPKYLHLYNADDSYPEAAAEWYSGERASRPFYSGERASRPFSCSAVRSGGFLYRNFDYPFDDRAEFVVKMSAGIQTPTTNNQPPTHRFASVGVAQVGTNLTEQMVTSGKPEYSRLYKWLPGATVDGINENGVVAEINVVDGDPQTSGWHTTGDLHPLAAVRWILDNATNAQHAAEYIAANIHFPPGWTQNFHYMIADETSTYIVENGTAYPSGGTGVSPVSVLTNFRLYPTRDTTGEGQERYAALMSGANITSQWWTLTYTPTGYRASDLPGITGDALTQLFDYWASKPREQHRGETLTTSHQPPTTSTWWQTVHTSVYDITNRTLRIAVQETDDWYVFAFPGGTGVSPVQVRAIATEVVAPVASDVTNLSHSVTNLVTATNNLTSAVSSLESSKLDKTEAGAKFVPYNGASEDVDLGANGIRAETVNATRVQAGTVEADNINCIAGQITATRIASSLGLTVYGNWGPEIAQDGFYTTGQEVFYTAGKRSYDSWEEVEEEGWNRFRRVTGRNDDGEVEYEYLGDVLEGKADNSTVSSLASRVSGLVPYNGATSDVSLGTHRLISAFGVVRTIIDAYGMEIESIEDGFGVRFGDIGISSHGASAYGMEDFNLNFPFGKSGDIAVEDPFEIVTLIDIASTNAAARASLSAKVMSVIDAAVEAKITTALDAHRIRTYDDVRHCWWVCDVVNGVPTWTVEE